MTRAKMPLDDATAVRAAGDAADADAAAAGRRPQDMTSDDARRDRIDAAYRASATPRQRRTVGAHVGND